MQPSVVMNEGGDVKHLSNSSVLAQRDDLYDKMRGIIGERQADNLFSDYLREITYIDNIKKIYQGPLFTVICKIVLTLFVICVGLVIPPIVMGCYIVYNRTRRNKVMFDYVFTSHIYQCAIDQMVEAKRVSQEVNDGIYKCWERGRPLTSSEFEVAGGQNTVEAYEAYLDEAYTWWRLIKEILDPFEKALANVQDVALQNRMCREDFEYIAKCSMEVSLDSLKIVKDDCVWLRDQCEALITESVWWYGLRCTCEEGLQAIMEKITPQLPQKDDSWENVVICFQNIDKILNEIESGGILESHLVRAPYGWEAPKRLKSYIIKTYPELFQTLAFKCIQHIEELFSPLNHQQTALLTSADKSHIGCRYVWHIEHHMPSVQLMDVHRKCMGKWIWHMENAIGEICESLCGVYTLLFINDAVLQRLRTLLNDTISTLLCADGALVSQKGMEKLMSVKDDERIRGIFKKIHQFSSWLDVMQEDRRLPYNLVPYSRNKWLSEDGVDGAKMDVLRKNIMIWIDLAIPSLQHTPYIFCQIMSMFCEEHKRHCIDLLTLRCLEDKKLLDYFPEVQEYAKSWEHPAVYQTPYSILKFQGYFETFKEEHVQEIRACKKDYAFYYELENEKQEKKNGVKKSTWPPEHPGYFLS